MQACPPRFCGSILQLPQALTLGKAGFARAFAAAIQLESAFAKCLRDDRQVVQPRPITCLGVLAAEIPFVACLLQDLT